MTVQLSSLRVTAEMDVSSYTRGMAQKVAADKDGAASAKAVGVALGQLDAAAKVTGDVTAKLSRQLIDGYSSAAKFEKVIRDVGRAVDTGMSLDRAAVQLDNVYRKYGLVADAAVLAQHGFVSIVPVIEELNRHYAEQNELLQQQSASATAAAEAAKAQAELEARIKSYIAAVDPVSTAQDRFNSAVAEAEDLYTAGAISIERYRMGVTKAQSALDAVAESARRAAAAQAQLSQNWFNTTLGVRDSFSTTNRGADMEAAIREAEREAAALRKAEQEAEAFNRALLGIRDTFSGRDGAADMEAALREADAQWRQMQALAQKEQDAINALLGVRDTFAAGNRGSDMEAAIREAEAETKRALAYAQQAQTEMNALLGVRTDFATDERARDIEAWSKELDRYFAGLVRVRAEEEQIARARRSANQNEINNLLGVRAPASDSAYAAQAKGYDELGQSIDNLRARVDPLFAAEMKHAKAMEEINLLNAMGEFSTDRYADVVRRATTVHEQTIMSLKNGAAEIGLNVHQWQNLGFQVNDVATMLLSGSSPFQVLATQGGQVVQILGMGQGGIAGSLRGIASTLVGMLSPIRLVIGGVAGLGIAAVASYASWINAQAEVERSLLGIGRASGATVTQINNIASAYASAGNVSISAATKMAASFASTGKIAPELFGDLITESKDLAKVLGSDTTAAAQKLSDALVEPARGAEQLNQILGAFDAATMKRIQSLDAQNRMTEAQRQIIEGVRNATQDAERSTTQWSRTWDSLGIAVSNVWTKLGQAIDAATGAAPLEAQKAALEARLRQIEEARASEAEHLQQLQKWGYSNDQINAEIPSLARLDTIYRTTTDSLRSVNEQLEKAAAKAKEARQALESLRLIGTINIVMPELDTVRQLQDRALVLAALAANPDMQAKVGVSQDQATLSAQRANEAAKSYLTTQQAATKQLELQNQAITARSPTERANLAYAQKIAELAGANVSEEEKRTQAQMAYNNALKEGSYALSEQERQRVRAIRDQVGATQSEIDGIGKTAQQAELLRLNWQSYADLRREAEQNHTAFDAAQYARLQKENEELARRNQLLRERQLYDELAFEQSQLGRSAIDQNVASRLRSAGMPVDMNSQAAAAIRYTETMKQAQSITSEFASTFVTDIAHGVDAMTALSNALTRFADQLLKMATDQLVAQAFGGLLGGGGGFGFGGGAAPVLTGSGFTTGIFHSGGVVTSSPATTRAVSPLAFIGAQRFHTGGIMGLGPRERPAVLELEEEVLRRDDPRHTFNGGRRAAIGEMISTTFAPVISIQGGGGDAASMRREVAEALREQAREIPALVIRTIREARAARVKGV